MKKTILTYGLLSSAVSVTMLAITLALSDQVGFDKGLIIGYTTIILSLSFIFFGIKSYRDRVGNGSITFGKGLAIGLSIAAIASLCYVLVWLIIYYNFMPDHLQQYADYTLEKMKAAGATPEAMAQKAEEMKKFNEMYQNPFFNAAVTLMEPFPVGVIMAFLSALFLRKKNADAAGA